jgi:acetolactate synthase I/III small subunit
MNQWMRMLTFVIHARRTPDVLARVVMLFHRRRVQIDSLTTVRGDKSDALRLEVTVEVDQAKARLIEANLCKLVDVLLVEKNHRDGETEHHATEDGHRES